MAAVEPDADTADREALKAKAASAVLVVQALVKADRAFSLYLPNNPLHGKFFEDFRRRVEEHLEAFGALSLDCAPDSLLLSGETIFSSEDVRENIAFRLYADGIRAIRLAEGIAPDELRSLVEIIGRSRADADEDDIVTRLWSADLPHVVYYLAETPPVGGSFAYGLTGSREAQEGAIRKYASELTSTEPAPLLPPIAHQVFSLSEEELVALQALLAIEERRNPLDDMAGILEAILGAEEDAVLLEEFLVIIVRLCGDLLLTGRVSQSVTLIGVLHRLGGREDLAPGKAAAIDAARGQVVTADVLEGLSRLLATGDGIDRESLRGLVQALGSAAIEPFCRILGDVPGKETRKVLVEVLAETGRDTPDLFMPFLGDARWFLVRNTIYILRRIASPEVARAVLRCAGHRDARVRKEVLLFFEETGEPGGEQLLFTLLGDETPALRIAAARGLARRGTSGAIERLLAVVTAPDFERCGLPEREAIWEALAELAPARVLPQLKEMLFKGGWFSRGRVLAETACAVAGLKRVGTPEAIEVLRRGSASKRGAARELIDKALRALARATPAPGRPGRGAGRG